MLKTSQKEKEQEGSVQNSLPSRSKEMGRKCVLHNEWEYNFSSRKKDLQVVLGGISVSFLCNDREKQDSISKVRKSKVLCSRIDI